MLQNEEQVPKHAFSLTITEAGNQHTPIISAGKLKELYTLMARLRAADPKRKSRRGKARRHCFGEACEVAAVIDLRPEDAVTILPDQRVALLASSENQPDGKLRGNSAAGWSVLEGGNRERLAMAAGIAFAQRMERKNSVVVAFATSPDIAGAADSVQLAHKQNLPIIYLEKTGANVPKLKPIPHNVPSIPVDENDAVAIYRVVYEAIDKARRGAGPTLIRCFELPLSTKARVKDQRTDPIAYMEHYLRKRSLWSDELRS